jgi:ABC-2 type transport system permease protein
VTGYDTEGEITYALQYVCLSDDQLTKAYSITGHNEISFESKFSDVIDKNNMQVSELSLLTSEKVPEDCKLLILNTPLRDYTQDEVQKVIDYLDNGGNVLIITYYKTYEPLENFAQILNYYGVTVEDGVIIEKDPERVIAGSDPYYILPVIGSDTITSGISQEGYGTVFTPLCQPLSYTTDEKVTVTELLKSSDQAYVQYMDAEDHVSDNGTFLIGLKANKELDSGSSTAVIYSSGDMFSDGANEIVGGNNLRLFTGTLNSLVTFDTELVMIPSKLADSPLSITGKVAIAILAIMFAVAATLIIVGLVVFIVRRRK